MNETLQDRFFIGLALLIVKLALHLVIDITVENFIRLATNTQYSPEQQNRMMFTPKRQPTPEEVEDASIRAAYNFSHSYQPYEQLKAEYKSRNGTGGYPQNPTPFRVTLSGQVYY